MLTGKLPTVERNASFVSNHHQKHHISFLAPTLQLLLYAALKAKDPNHIDRTISCSSQRPEKGTYLKFIIDFGEIKKEVSDIPVA